MTSRRTTSWLPKDRVCMNIKTIKKATVNYHQLLYNVCASFMLINHARVVSENIDILRENEIDEFNSKETIVITVVLHVIMYYISIVYV